MKDIVEAIATRSDRGLNIRNFVGKGRGVTAARVFRRGEFVTEYTGEILSATEAKRREEEYATDNRTGSYMFYFKHEEKRYCIDGTPESTGPGRLINHSRRDANLQPKLTIIRGRPHIVFFAKKEIRIGDELLYDYGDRTKESLSFFSWLGH